MKIKNVIFDLGGVILNLDFKRTVIAFQNLGVMDIDITIHKEWLFLLKEFETGKIPTATFRNLIQKELNIQISEKEFDQAWNALIVDIPAVALEVLKNTKLSYKTFLLSNINELHYEELQKILLHQHQLVSLKDYFDKEYYSHLFGFRKPNIETFQKVLLENQLIPNETVFIDDTLEHIEGAKKVGIHTIHIANGVTLQGAVKSIEKL